MLEKKYDCFLLQLCTSDSGNDTHKTARIKQQFHKKQETSDRIMAFTATATGQDIL